MDAIETWKKFCVQPLMTAIPTMWSTGLSRESSLGQALHKYVNGKIIRKMFYVIKAWTTSSYYT